LPHLLGGEIFKLAVALHGFAVGRAGGLAFHAAEDGIVGLSGNPIGEHAGHFVVKGNAVVDIHHKIFLADGAARTLLHANAAVLAKVHHFQLAPVIHLEGIVSQVGVQGDEAAHAVHIADVVAAIAAEAAVHCQQLEMVAVAHSFGAVAAFRNDVGQHGFFDGFAGQAVIIIIGRHEGRHRRAIKMEVDGHCPRKDRHHNHRFGGGKIIGHGEFHFAQISLKGL